MKKNITIGMDLGDRNHEICILDAEGTVVHRKQVGNTAKQIRSYFEGLDRGRVALEAGTHSGWISRLLESLGFKVIVAQPRMVKLVWSRDRKNDESDAELLARLLRVDPSLLSPIKHRSEKAQTDLLMIKARDSLVQVRTKLINQVRGLGKSLGHRFAKCDANYFSARARADLPPMLSEAISSLLDVIDDVSRRIKEFDRQITLLAHREYPETRYLESVPGVAALTALGYVLTIDDPCRFKRSREVGPYLGLVPRQDQSGSMDKQLRITKAGDAYMRRLLVGSAQCILKTNGPDCQLRDRGLRIAARGGKNGKKRAVVATARSLSVLLHKLWVSKTYFDPQYGRVDLAA